MCLKRSVVRFFPRLFRVAGRPYVNENVRSTNLLGDHSVVDPPDSMPNSEVKRNSADGSVGFPHVRVGHRQALISIELV